MKTHHFIFSCILATSAFFFGCQQEVSPLLPEGENDGNPGAQSESLLIDPAITELSEIHAQNVARLFRQKSIETKAGGVTLTTTTETVTPILDEEGDPLMYVINFADNGGFTIVSATKSYYPILAYADEGHFDCPEVLPGGIDIWVTERKEEILYCKENEASLDTSFKLMWSEYEMQAEAPPMTRAEISDATSALLSAWTANGYSVVPLSAADAVIPSNYYTNFTNLVNTNANPQYASWAFVIYKRSNSEYTKGPLLGNIAWHQGNGFNNLIPGQPVPAAGCVNIALAQIMYYHQYPGSYNWSAMSPTTGNPAAQALIRDLYSATGGNGGATISQAKSALSSFGYTYTQQDHNSTTIIQNINTNRPVYMRGTDSNGNGGHAWVCDGYKTTSPKIDFLLAFVPNGPVQYDTYGPYSYTSTTTIYYFNHNWGWGSGPETQNGWFSGETIQTTMNGGPYNPTVDRKELINIAPN